MSLKNQANVLVCGILFCVLGACTSSGGESSELLGTWYVDDGPDGNEYCLIVCDEERAFTGDSACTETSRSDFSAYYRYSVVGDDVTFSTSDGPAFTLTLTASGDTLTMAADLFGEFNPDVPGPFELTRVAPSPLCEDATIPAR